MMLGAFFVGVGIAAAAVEKQYEESEIDMPRDDQGVQLNDAEDVRRDIPDSRKMNSIVTNVVKAEERDQYTSRMIQDVRKELNDRIDILETRIAEIQGQIIGVKQTLVQSGISTKTAHEISDSETAGADTAEKSASKTQTVIY